MTKKAQHIQLRKKVQLLALQGLNNTQIAKKLNVTRNFVIKWKDEEDVSVDKRGWKKGKKRKYTDEQERLVIQKRLDLENKFFSELNQSYNSCLENNFLKISLNERLTLTNLLNLTEKNRKVDQPISSIPNNGYPSSGHYSKSTSSVLVI